MAAVGALDNLKQIGRRGIGAPVVLLAALAMVMLPLPPFLLDMLFSFNIALSLVILLAVIYVMRPLEFAAFPTVVLMATLLRLALNIASTRVVLLHGHDGPGAAGKVIEAFGEFVIGGNFAVGLVVFAILTIINFVVVTKGATRVSEVTARFTLDAMPGKQMAIDADLNAGLLTQEQARERRQEVREEADFYGSMDGASKFVRGDATAGILILIINIVGGFFVGVMQHGLSAGEAAKTYTLLTIGDGLVAQVPALMLSVATAIIVTRVSRAQDMGRQLAGQVFGQPRALAVAAVVLGVMGVIPGMPNVAFLLLGAGCGAAAYMIAKRAKTPVANAANPNVPALAGPGGEAAELGWDDVQPVDAVGLDVGYRLIPLVDRTQGGELMGRIKAVRRKLSQELGFLVPSVHIRDNLDLAPGGYRITLLGVPVGAAEIHPDRLLAINPGRVHGTVMGIATRDPAFGLEALWIEAGTRDHAQTLGYTVVDHTTIIATHLSETVRANAHNILGRGELQHLFEVFSRTTPKLVEDLVPNLLSFGEVLRVMRNLLRESVSIRDLRSILEALTELAPQTRDPEQLTELSRQRLSRQITASFMGSDGTLSALVLDAPVEEMFRRSLREIAQGTGGALDPEQARLLGVSLEASVKRMTLAGRPACVVTSPDVRRYLRAFAERRCPSLAVLSFRELEPDVSIRPFETITLNKAAA